MNTQLKENLEQVIGALKQELSKDQNWYLSVGEILETNHGDFVCMSTPERNIEELWVFEQMTDEEGEPFTFSKLFEFKM